MMIATPLTQTVPASKNQNASNNETSAIQSFFVLFIRMKLFLSFFNGSGGSHSPQEFIDQRLSPKNQSSWKGPRIDRILPV